MVTGEPLPEASTPMASAPSAAPFAISMESDSPSTASRPFSDGRRPSPRPRPPRATRCRSRPRRSVCSRLCRASPIPAPSSDCPASRFRPVCWTVYRSASISTVPMAATAISWPSPRASRRRSAELHRQPRVDLSFTGHTGRPLHGPITLSNNVIQSDES